MYVVWLCMDDTHTYIVILSHGVLLY
jgi:hypothetical protein